MQRPSLNMHTMREREGASGYACALCHELQIGSHSGCKILPSLKGFHRHQTFHTNLPPSSSSTRKSKKKENPQYLPSQLHQLPPGVIDRIRACLPMSAYVRSSLVSKSWSYRTFSPHLLSLCAEMRPPEPWLFAISRRPCRNWSYAFDRIYSRWRRLPLSFLPLDFLYPVASSVGGLLCFSTYHDNEQTLSIVNPLMRTWRELPRWDKEDSMNPFIEMLVEANNSYKILAVGSYEAEAVTEVYDSTTIDTPDALLVFNLESGTWSEITILMPSSYLFGKLVAHRDKILLLGCAQETEEGFRSIRIWEFCEPGEEMNEVERMPDGILKELCGTEKETGMLQFVSCGDLLYLRAEKNPRLLLCDLTKKPVQWQWLPPSPTCVAWSELYFCSFQVHPGLVASM